MKFIGIVIGLCLGMPLWASAATLTCAELQKAYQQDQMNVDRYSCGRHIFCRSRQFEQLKSTVRFFTQDNISGKSFADLKAEYDPIFTRINVGKTGFEVVNIDLGDNSFLLFFDRGAAKTSGISISDGTLEVDAKYCEGVEFEPVINDARVEKICQAIVPVVNQKLPGLQGFNQASCTARDGVYNDYMTDVYAEKFNRTQVTFQAMRNLTEFGGKGYFDCSVKMDRKKNAVLGAECAIK